MNVPGFMYLGGHITIDLNMVNLKELSKLYLHILSNTAAFKIKGHHEQYFYFLPPEGISINPNIS